MSLLVRNVQVLGSPKELPERSDVFITGGVISAIGSFPNKNADEVIEGQGSYLSPGFIDVDTTSDHYLSLFKAPSQEDFLKQGVTTIVGGVCGASLAPLLYGSLEAIGKWGDPASINIDWHTVKELLAILQRQHLGVNFATLAGHSTIRRALIGEDIRDLTKNELSVFEGILQRGLDEGAFGMSVGLEYVHTRATPYQELKALSSLLAKNKGIFAAHLRHTAEGVHEGLQEIIKIQKESGVSTLVHHMVPILGHEEDYAKALELLEALPQDTDLNFSVYPIAGSIEPLYRLLPEWAQNGNLELMRKNIEDAWLSKRILKDMTGLNPDAITVEAARQPELVGRTLRDYMEIAGSDTPEAALLSLMRATRLKAVVSLANIEKEALSRALLHPRALIGSHAAGGASAMRGFMRERAEGTFSAFLKHIVEADRLEEGIRKITSVPAQKLGLAKRGVVTEGSVADLVVFRGDSVKHVIVNGKIAIKDGEPTGVTAGTTLRRTNP